MKQNIPKTKTIFISSKQGVNKIMTDPPVLEVAEERLHVSESEKLLGIHLDNTMSWASHVEAIIIKKKKV